VTIAVHASTGVTPIVDALAAIRARHGEGPVHGITPGLVVADPTGWVPATRYVDGSALPGLLADAHRRWGAGPAAAAALAWKSYTYWLLLPAVLGYASVRRVPVLTPENTLVRPHVSAPFVEMGMREPLVAVRPDDPLAGRPHTVVVADLPGYFRKTLLDGHLSPILEHLHELVRVGRRTLLGSVASGVAYALVRAGDTATVGTLLDALGVADLVEVTDGPGVQRRTCCLAFTLPEPKVCQGCCISSC
jgi:hypothetical protein